MLDGHGRMLLLLPKEQNGCEGQIENITTSVFNKLIAVPSKPCMQSIVV